MAREVITSTGKKAWITNQMADGTILDDVKGYVVPLNEKTWPAYNLLYIWGMRALAKSDAEKAAAEKEKEQQQTGG